MKAYKPVDIVSKVDVLRIAKAICSAGSNQEVLGVIRNNYSANHEKNLSVMAHGLTSLAEALTSAQHGKSSTLDQARAWRMIHQYMVRSDLLTSKEGSEVERVIASIDDLRKNGAHESGLFADEKYIMRQRGTNSSHEVEMKFEDSQNYYTDRGSFSKAQWALERTPTAQHALFEEGDKDAPDAIKDRKGEIALRLCQVCGKGEAKMEDAVLKLARIVEPGRLEVMKRLLVLQDTCHGLAEQAGWWKDLETGEDVRTWPKKHLDNWISAKLMLTVTEVAEAMEGHRKGLMDDKLPHRKMLEVELADAVIRIMDLAGGLNLDVGGAIVEKLAYNLTRADHKIENRMAEGGKSV